MLIDIGIGRRRKLGLYPTNSLRPCSSFTHSTNLKRFDLNDKVFFDRQVGILNYKKL